MSDQLDLHLDPDESPPHAYQRLPPLKNALLRLSGRAKIVTLKKYLVSSIAVCDSFSLMICYEFIVYSPVFAQVMKLGLKDCSKSSVRFWNIIINVGDTNLCNWCVSTLIFHQKLCFQIEITCNGDIMGDELSLTFILRTRWFSTNKVLALKYRLEEEENIK